MSSQAMQCVLAESTETAALEGVAVVLSTIANVYISMNSCSHVVVYATVDTYDYIDAVHTTYNYSGSAMV